MCLRIIHVLPFSISLTNSAMLVVNHVVPLGHPLVPIP